MANAPPTHKPPRLMPGRESASKRGYGTCWHRTRRAFLRVHPVCQACGVRCATEVDHRVALTKGGADEWDNYVALCKRCHSKKTVACDGGFGRPKKDVTL